MPCLPYLWLLARVSSVSPINYRSMPRRFQSGQKEGLAVSGVDGRGLGWALSRKRPAWYTGSHVRGRVALSPPSRASIWVTVRYPRLIMAGE